MYLSELLDLNIKWDYIDQSYILKEATLTNMCSRTNFNVLNLLKSLSVSFVTERYVFFCNWWQMYLFLFQEDNI